jgi:hypothetical protein
MALLSRSSQQTCAVLEQMYSATVFPTPQLAERLAKAGRHVIQILGRRLADSFSSWLRLAMRILSPLFGLVGLA